jgi:signal transduction histidine kinase
VTARAFSVILLDYRLPRMDGLELLARIRALGVSTPVVIATAQGDERVAVEAMHAGAIDYVVKSAGYFQTLPTVLNKVLEQAALAREHAWLLEESRRQQCQLAQIFDSTSDAIVLVDAHGRLVRANRRAGELLAFDPGGATGTGFAALLGPVGDSAAGLLAFLDSAEAEASGEIRLETPRVLHWTGRRMDGVDGTTATLTLHDLTEERRISQMKSDFVSFVAHQLRTPLAGIKWMLELAGEAAEPAAQQSCVEDAAASADRLITMVNDLLNISRLESGGFIAAATPVALGTLTRAALRDLASLAEERRHSISFDEDDGTPPASGDPELLRQIVVNLISNALKYSPPGGRIAVRLRGGHGEVHWEVEDNGIGIPESARRHLFEKFYRADNAVTLETEGTGLGLYLVALATRHCGGEVSWVSDVGRGTTFRLRLPAAR